VQEGRVGFVDHEEAGRRRRALATLAGRWRDGEKLGLSAQKGGQQRVLHDGHGGLFGARGVGRALAAGLRVVFAGGAVGAQLLPDPGAGDGQQLGGLVVNAGRGVGPVAVDDREAHPGDALGARRGHPQRPQRGLDLLA
jgi:hypothetical protein